MNQFEYLMRWYNSNCIFQFSNHDIVSYIWSSSIRIKKKKLCSVCWPSTTLLIIYLLICLFIPFSKKKKVLSLVRIFFMTICCSCSSQPLDFLIFSSKVNCFSQTTKINRHSCWIFTALSYLLHFIFITPHSKSDQTWYCRSKASFRLMKKCEIVQC